jgi:hypothetical protein
VSGSVQSATLGPVAIYRQWVVDPDGADVENQWTPRRHQYCLRSAQSLLAAILTMKMVQQLPAPPERPSAVVIQFPGPKRAWRRGGSMAARRARAAASDAHDRVSQRRNI